MDDAERDRVVIACRRLHAAEQPVRVLRHIAWPEQVKREFFDRGGTELPVVDYAPFDPGPTGEALAEARRQIVGDGPVAAWLRRVAASIETGARMLAATGTAAFFEQSSALYGAPGQSIGGEGAAPLDLAQRFEELLATMLHVDLGAPPPACHLASAVADALRRGMEPVLGADAPVVEVVDHLSANALAGPRRIRIRREACFTDKDAAQLLQHEAMVHVVTSLNGRAQVHLPILGASHPGTTRIQEGLAVFAEFITGAMDLDRFRRLAARVTAIQMAVDGADFLDVFRFFLERTDSPDQSFESARRVFRGGVITGGAPFTKDVVYLDGLLRVHTFLEEAVRAGRADCIRLLFAGKLAVADLPALCELAGAGLCLPPRFLPPWAADLRGLLTHLAYSGFLSAADFAGVRTRYAQMLAAAPGAA